MSITDSTTTIDTAWSEKDIAVWNAGTLASIGAIVDEIESKCHREFDTSSEPTLAQVENWAKRAKAEIATVLGYDITNRYVTMNMVVSQYAYSLPPDFAGRLRLYDIDNRAKVIIWPKNQFFLKYPDPSQENENPPSVACIDNNRLFFAPPPDDTYEIQAHYVRSGADNTPSDFSWLPELERWRCVDYALYELYESLKQFDIAQIYFQKYAVGMQGSKTVSGRKKWQGVRHQVQNVFQEYSARSYQQKYVRP